MLKKNIGLVLKLNFFCKNSFNKSLDELSKPTNGSSKIIKSDSLAKILIKANFFAAQKIDWPLIHPAPYLIQGYSSIS